MSKYSKNIPPSIIGAIGWFYDDLDEGISLLDFGCSTGYYGAYIKEHKKATVYGVEISEDKKEAAKVLDGVYSFDLDGEWPEEVYERKYDAVFFGDVIEHLKDPERALRLTRKLLNKNGRVYVSTPNIAHISIRLELLGGNFEYESMGILDNTHLKYFTYDSLTKICVAAGYDIMRIDSSISDYPKEVIESYLEKYGLKPSKKFWEVVNDPKARTFQYKLVLSPAKKTTKTRVPDPIKKPEQYKKDFIQNLYDALEKSQKEAIQSKAIAEEQEKNNKKLLAAIEDIRNSQTFKLAKGLSGMKQKIKRSKRK